MPASCRRVGLVSWSKGGRGVGWMGRCGVLGGVLSPGLMRKCLHRLYAIAQGGYFAIK